MTVYAACGRALVVGLKVQTLNAKVGGGGHWTDRPGRVVGTVAYVGPGCIRIREDSGRVSTRRPSRVRVHG